MHRILSLLSILILSIACGGGGGGGSSATTTNLAPSSVSFKAINNTISSGTGILASSGTGIAYYFPNSIYLVEGDGVNTTNSAGTYSMSVTDSDTISISTVTSGVTVTTVSDYSTSSTGSFVSATGSDSQTGSFSELNNSSFPASSVTGKTYNMTIVDGDNPFASTGTATIIFTSATAYTLTGDGVNVADSSGTYTYTPNSSGGYSTLVLDDTTFGSAITYYLVFKSGTAGGFSARAGSIGQAGLFSE